MAKPCSEEAISEKYADFIVEYTGQEAALEARYHPDCYETLGPQFAVIYKALPENGRLSPDAYNYQIVPHLLGLLDTTSMEQSGILPVHQSPRPGYRGNGVMVGIIDTGIDYTHPAFMYSDGSTRIVDIWDQGDTSGRFPEGFSYGSVYSREDINEALRSDDPYSIVPERDTEGHGTFMAGVMAGSESISDGFIGAAPEAAIAVVRLKQSKQYLRDYYFIPEGVLAYQENDIMTGVGWLLNLSKQYQMPIIICIGVGNNLSSHDGSSKLCRFLTNINDTVGAAVVVAAGNELGLAHHSSGIIETRDTYTNVELRVGENEEGFQMELWGVSADAFSVEIISPEGERINRGPSRLGQSQTTELVFEGTTVYIADKTGETEGGQFLLVMRFERPSAGIWTMRVYGDRVLSGRFDIYLPMEKFISDQTYFLAPDPDKTLSTVATAPSLIVSATYNHYTGGLYIHSSRGYTADGYIKPDFVAPGVDVYGPLPGGRYGQRTGSSIAAAHAAGAAALLMEWGIYGENIEDMDGNDIRRLFIRGAVRRANYTYPDRGWGYGELNLKNTFESLRNVL